MNKPEKAAINAIAKGLKKEGVKFTHHKEHGAGWIEMHQEPHAGVRVHSSDGKIRVIYNNTYENRGGCYASVSLADTAKVITMVKGSEIWEFDQKDNAARTAS